MDVGGRLLHALCVEGDSYGLYRAKVTEDYFVGDELAVYEWLKDYSLKHGKLPQPATLLEHFPGIPKAPEPSGFYLEQVENRYRHRTLNRGLVECSDLMKDKLYDKVTARMAKALGDVYMVDVRQQMAEFTEDAWDLVKEAYTKAQIPGNGIKFGWEYLDDMTAGLFPGDVVSYVGRPAMGKAQPLTAPVLTPSGWVRMGDLKVGDSVASVDGTVSKVTGVYPQGELDIFRLSFSDGRSCVASADHLWEVWYRDWGAARVLKTADLLALLGKRRYQNRLSIRLFSGDFGSSWSEPFSPYLLGLLLGDGCLRATTPRLTTADSQVVETVREELSLHGMQLNHLSRYDYSLVDPKATKVEANRLKSWLEALGVWGLGSDSKFIPEQFMVADRSARLALLQGLMDTDGMAEKAGGISFSSNSLRLATQVQTLVRSLGGKATLSAKATTGLPHYRVFIVMKDRSECFRLERKRDRVLEGRTTHTNHRLTLSAISFEGRAECQCISVSHPDRLYVTSDFVVTHNTYLQLYSAHQMWWLQHKNVMFFSMEMPILALVQRIAAIHTGITVTDIKQGTLPKFPVNMEMKLAQKMLSVKDHDARLWIFDGNLAATPQDIYGIAAQLKPDVVFIDGAYLLRHENPKMDRYVRVAENVESIKQLTGRQRVPTICTYQFKREAAKKGKKATTSEVPQLEDIAYSDAIGQTSSVVLGLFQEETVETLKTRSIAILKGREGETGQFQVHWNFQSMNFSEVKKSGTLEELEAPLDYL